MAYRMIVRESIAITCKVRGPEKVTFGYQPGRGGFSVWFVTTEPKTYEYALVLTGGNLDDEWEFVDSAVAGDGLRVYHLVRRPYTPRIVDMGG